jgi:tetratricopeptide (TPR) repeat protein
VSDQQMLLTPLDAGGDPRAAVRAVFSWSYRCLEPDTAHAFRLLGLHPGPDFAAWSAAALIGATAGQARHMLDDLARVHLIQVTSSGRYGQHDLLRAYARELASDQDSEDSRRAALTRLFDYFLYTSASAMDTLYPAERHRRPRIDVPIPAEQPLKDPVAARAWLDSERAALVAVAVHATEHGWPGHATRLAATLFRYLEIGGHPSEAVTIHTHARTAARQTGDQAAEATALNALGVTDRHQGRNQQALANFEQALALFQRVSDHASGARTLSNIGVISIALGRGQQATSYFERALAAFRQADDQVGEGFTLGNLANVEQQQGHYQQAAHHYQQALDIARKTGNQHGACTALVNLGEIATLQAQYEQAAGFLDSALSLSRGTGYRIHEATALIKLGDLYRRQDLLPEAFNHLRTGLSMYQELGDRAGEADALNSLGHALLASGQPGEARSGYAAALGAALQCGDRPQEARARNGLGHACHALDDDGQARDHWRTALALYTGLGAPEAGNIRTQLTAVAGDRDSEPG